MHDCGVLTPGNALPPARPRSPGVPRQAGDERCSGGPGGTSSTQHPRPSNDRGLLRCQATRSLTLLPGCPAFDSIDGDSTGRVRQHGDNMRHSIRLLLTAFATLLPIASRVSADPTRPVDATVE